MNSDTIVNETRAIVDPGFNFAVFFNFFFVNNCFHSNNNVFSYHIVVFNLKTSVHLKSKVEES